MRTSQAHIAGVGLSVSRESNDSLDKLAISAATKALLDAGVIYGEVDECFACFDHDLRIAPSSFDTLGMQGAPICEVNNSFGLNAAAQSVWSRRANCSLVVGIDGAASNKTNRQSAIVAVVIVSDLFLTSHAYLKDGAVRILGAALVSRFHSRTKGGEDSPRKIKTAVNSALSQAKIDFKDVQVLDLVGSGLDKAALKTVGDVSRKSSPNNPVSSDATTGFTNLCGVVWQLRGWAGDAGVEVRNALQLTLDAAGVLGVLVLSRSDGRPALKWSEVENVRDGRERLGYNPAVESRNISREDIENVRAREHFVPANIDIKQLGFADKGGDRAALARL
ncbi:hypothetical protein M409DRAFT_16446 [Zasmidium cellare ATCC 36951]|uniref:Thiolase N-terminal domain-containing protein n=1 Tax=Zasmidium cellare ATCC 36951 TaxID=1080233 RepID=A0A6A6D455_ZASCE|nr:uncharacterized protein M409DRAFT_16446 [Zasmidium cellare ATCC 36951]KAF2174177.1 hypothetical protein M409DRAFT_16446 [Zasmidium cellare ATCC 36951]